MQNTFYYAVCNLADILNFKSKCKHTLDALALNLILLTHERNNIFTFMFKAKSHPMKYDAYNNTKHKIDIIGNILAKTFDQFKSAMNKK